MTLLNVFHGFYHKYNVVGGRVVVFTAFMAILATSAAARSEPELLQVSSLFWFLSDCFLLYLHRIYNVANVKGLRVRSENK